MQPRSCGKMCFNLECSGNLTLTLLKWDMEVSWSWWQGPGGQGVRMQRKNMTIGPWGPRNVGQNIFSRTNSPKIPLSPAVSLIILSFSFFRKPFHDVTWSMAIFSSSLISHSSFPSESKHLKIWNVFINLPCPFYFGFFFQADHSQKCDQIHFFFAEWPGILFWLRILGQPMLVSSTKVFSRFCLIFTLNLLK